ncbi:PREDICTED: protein trichome birefringence-like 41 [Tarenaya hassleriana]|uniref:protein trichome birefringence-like 41 n=1 Tax=Tarenaya hassleriana TaxID=28532 RepID=UPI00053CA759|nr:PREDICTED: protein trichome birefringence-like 41 [Tarenaya hassleriana]
MGFRVYVISSSVFVLLQFASLLLVQGKGCDMFTGRWVKDASYPFYDPSACPFIEREFACQRNGRSDLDFTTFRWQPLHCKLARFNGVKFLERHRGKKIMFVGDSLSLNQWQSLTCILHSSVPNSPYNITRQGDVSSFIFKDYGVEVMVDRNVYLVDVVRESIGRVLKLDSIKGSKLWTGIDMLIFNTWHWWSRRGPTQPWDWIQIGGNVTKDMDRMVAFEKALDTWGKWVDDFVDPQKTIVFFQGISPSHYNGVLWGEPKAKSCLGQKQPLLGTTYPGGLPPEVGILKKSLSKISKPVILLDVTMLSLLRKDGHPSVFGLGGQTGMDCSHWCLPGVPDTWNEILYNYLVK